jgi:hypothetical protein
MSAADAFSLLYSAAPFVNGIDPLAAQLEARILGIVESLPRWTLHFRKDSGLWDIIETL